MRNLLLAVVLLFASLFGRAQTATVISHAHGNTYHIEQTTVLAGAMCSATAVGPHALLTASHCEMATDELEIQGVDDPVRIVGKIRDGMDHTIYLLSGITFKDQSTIDESTKLSQGDPVFMFGNPGGWSDLFRRGYYSGTSTPSPLSDDPATLLFDMSVWHGDSGSAIFSNDGEIVGVVSLIESQKNPDGSNGIVMEGSLPMKFTEEQIEHAQSFGTFKEVQCQHLLQYNCSIQ